MLNSISDVGKRCPSCSDLIGYMHDEGCPNDVPILMNMSDVYDTMRYSSVDEHFLRSQRFLARREASRQRPLEDQFVGMLSPSDLELLADMRISLSPTPERPAAQLRKEDDSHVL